MSLLCDYNNAAQRRYRKSALGVAAGYTLIFFAVEFYVRRVHPLDWRLYVAALLPTLSIVCFLFIIGRYLREEKDEFVRDQFIRSLLWGVAALMSYIMFVAFLRSFGWEGTTKPFAEYFIFCLTLLLAKYIYKIRARVKADE